MLGKIAEAVVEGLAYLYNEHRILHRDIKPSNILLNSRGQIKLCDFGVSGELTNSLADTFVGTQTYMAPERILGAKYTVKSDVWSVGLTLLELAIGKFPFDSDDSSQGPRQATGPLGILDLLQRIVNEPPPKLPESDAFPKSLHEFIDHCLRKEPTERASLNDLLVSTPLKGCIFCTGINTHIEKRFYAPSKSNAFGPGRLGTEPNGSVQPPISQYATPKPINHASSTSRAIS